MQCDMRPDSHLEEEPCVLWFTLAPPDSHLEEELCVVGARRRRQLHGEGVVELAPMLWLHWLHPHLHGEGVVELRAENVAHHRRALHRREERPQALNGPRAPLVAAAVALKLGQLRLGAAALSVPLRDPPFFAKIRAQFLQTNNKNYV